MADTRRRNVNWTVCEDAGECVSFDAAQLAVLMDIRDEMQTLVSLARCHRIPRALDAMTELGAEARRKKRLAARKRKARK